MFLVLVMALGMLPTTALAASSTIGGALSEVNITNGDYKMSYLSMNGVVRSQSYTYFNFKSASGAIKEIPAYCINPTTKGVPQTVGPGQSIKYIANEASNDPKIVGIIANGYPHRGLSELKLENKYQAYYAIALSDKEAAEIMKKLPADLSEERKQVVLTAYQLLGKVNYFWGGKSLVLGWDSRWGTPMEVTAAGSSTTGTMRPFGLDCSGFVDWVFYNQSGGSYVIGHGGGASSQHSYCTDIPWSDAQPGDLVFYPGDSHVGIVCGFDGNGNVLIIHCASGYNNVVVTGKSGFTSIGHPTHYAD